MPTLDTATLSINYTDAGRGRPVILLHGWPDAARGWATISDSLVGAGYRVLIPDLRGSGRTRFLDDSVIRDGTAPALAQDVLDFADALDLERFAVVGHDWGARTAYRLAATAPARLTCIAALAIGYQPRGRFTIGSFALARPFWYQWLMYVSAGVEAIAGDPIGFARIQWETWSPPGWFDDTEFDATAESFRNADWVAITLNSYRTRFLADEPTDARYDPIRAALAATEHLDVPTLMIQGGADYCDPPASSEGLDPHFTDYRRVVLTDVGHFPHRESPSGVLDALLPHLSRWT